MPQGWPGPSPAPEFPHPQPRAAPLDCTLRLLHQPWWGRSLGKFPFRFLLPPGSLLLLSLGASLGSPHPWCPARRNTPRPELSPLPPARPRTRCRPSSVWWWEMGRYLTELPHSPLWGPLRPSCPGIPEEAPCSAGVLERWPCELSLLLPGTLRGSPWGELRTASCFLPTLPRKLPGWRVQDCGWGCLGSLVCTLRARVGLPWDLSLQLLGCRCRVGNQKSGLCP